MVAVSTSTGVSFLEDLVVQAIVSPVTRRAVIMMDRSVDNVRDRLEPAGARRKLLFEIYPPPSIETDRSPPSDLAPKGAQQYE